jgi:hypothetical protein
VKALMDLQKNPAKVFLSTPEKSQQLIKNGKL